MVCTLKRTAVGLLVNTGEYQKYYSQKCSPKEIPHRAIRQFPSGVKIILARIVVGSSSKRVKGQCELYALNAVLKGN